MIKIITVGKLKESYLVNGVQDYFERIKKYDKIEILELTDNQNPNLSENEVLRKEARLILDKIQSQSYVILLDIDGKMYDSLTFSKTMQDLYTYGKSQIVFIIGGSMGVDATIKSRADLRISFSRLTFPFGLARLILLEQIYRSFKIISNETYHK